MLKLKLFLSLIKKNWKLPVYLIITLIVFKFYWDFRQELNASKRREHNLKTLVFKATEGLRTQAEVKKELEGVYLL